jgi:hypothetical protein
MARKKTVGNTPAITAKEKSELISKLALTPSANAAAVVQAYTKGSFGETEIHILMDELRTQFTNVENGDLSYCEAMLVGQANALQAIFVNLARRATNQEYVKSYEMYLRLALKAQNQSRMTLETLATIKNPPVVFAKQANINHGNGNQQVNNGTPSPDANTPTLTGAHAGENKIPPNELLEVQHGGETLDSNATSAAIGKDKAMAALG